MVESAVRILYTSYAPLRNQGITSLKSLNAVLHEQLFFSITSLTKQPYSRSRFFKLQWFPLFKLPPAEPFIPKKVVLFSVQRNYHVQLSEDHLDYKVPYQYMGKKVQVLYDKRTGEVYYDNCRIALHLRKPHGKAYTTLGENMPPNHQRMQQISCLNKDGLPSQSTRIGAIVVQAAAFRLENSIYIGQNYKACFGMLRL